MTRREVRDFIEQGVNLLSQTISFNSGRISEFNSEPDKKYPYTWLESLSVTPNLSINNMPIDDWAISIWIVKIDRMDSLPKEYEDIIDDCDRLAQQLLYIYNNQIDGLNTISGISRDPIIKKLSDVTTGVNFTFTLTSPDRTKLC